MKSIINLELLLGVAVGFAAVRWHQKFIDHVNFILIFGSRPKHITFEEVKDILIEQIEGIDYGEITTEELFAIGELANRMGFNGTQVLAGYGIQKASSR